MSMFFISLYTIVFVFGSWKTWPEMPPSGPGVVVATNPDLANILDRTYLDVHNSYYFVLRFVGCFVVLC